MKNKNQTGQSLLELSANAANEDGFSSALSRDVVPSTRKPAWSPYEVWRTRVKAPDQKAPPLRRP